MQATNKNLVVCKFLWIKLCIFINTSRGVGSRSFRWWRHSWHFRGNTCNSRWRFRYATGIWTCGNWFSAWSKSRWVKRLFCGSANCDWLGNRLIRSIQHCIRIYFWNCSLNFNLHTNSKLRTWINFLGLTRLASIVWGSSAMASSTEVMLVKVINPKPLDRLEMGSFITTASSITPYFEKYLLRLSAQT